jgi:predicted CopG family antitoxin
MGSKIIKVKTETKARLDEIKHPGQTYSGVIQELIQNKENNEQEK